MKIIPNLITDGVLDLNAEFLTRRGIKLLLCDLDNTLAPYGGKPPSQALLDWKKSLNDADIEVFIISNTRKPRADLFAEQLGADYIKHARKPRPENVLRVIASRGLERNQVMMVGDQLLTDVLGANLCGVTSVLVRPISLNNPLYRLRNLAERGILRLFYRENSRPA
ncbi:MAG: YqeG family HAD IIIA-type phosphatase [Oscillospiraceae bacterium]|jgi:HAD superfamily phosphatase (TIGR01668 family)|nr:YqeG family HAD IIIA-type phosphatase [Oscillospiraceae bacterium]